MYFGGPNVILSIGLAESLKGLFDFFILRHHDYQTVVIFSVVPQQRTQQTAETTLFGSPLFHPALE